MSYEEELLHLECAKLWRENEKLYAFYEKYSPIIELINNIYAPASEGPLL